MRFLADESVERPLVDLVRGAGHDVLYVAEVSPALEDEQVLDLANAEGRILVTNDKDFGKLVFATGRASAGILLIRIGRERTAQKAPRLRELLRTRLGSLPGHFTVLGPSRVRRRPLRRTEGS